MAKDANSYDQAFTDAINELMRIMQEREDLDTKREALDRRIRSLRHGVMGLGTLRGMAASDVKEMFPECFPNIVDPDTGVTDAVRKALKSGADFYYSAVGVRDKLRTQGYPIDNYTNPLATIHTILKRLKKAKEVLEGSRDGKAVYKWKAELPEIGPPQMTKPLTRRQERKIKEVTPQALESIKTRVAASTREIVNDEIEKDKARK